MISVCIPTYNGEKYIKDQLLSILSQICENDEIIISDDQSTDNTLKIIELLGDSRIKVFTHQDKRIEELSPYMFTTRNVENAIRNATGDFIYLADQDDIWNTNKVSKIQELFNNYDLVLSDCSLINEHSFIICDSYFNLNNSKRGIINNLVHNSYLGCCMAFKKELLNYVYPFSKFNVPHDIWIGLLGDLFFKVYFEPSTLVKYRRHGNNLSASGEKSSNTIKFKILYRLIIIQALVRRVFFLFKCKTLDKLYN